MSIDLSRDAGLLVFLAEEVRGKTLELLDNAKERELFWTPPGIDNHILWQAGHALWLADKLIIAAATGRGELEDSWGQIFGNRCRPPQETKDWPDRETVRKRLADQLPRLTALLAALSNENLTGPPCHQKLSPDRSLCFWITHALQDEANHQGEMHLLLKMQRHVRK